MPEGYQHLAYDQRCQIYALKQRKDSNSAIAKQLGVHRSTICRELKRNSGQRGYRYKQAEEKASERRSSASKQKRKMTTATQAVVEEKLRSQWSPVQISGWLKRDHGEQEVSQNPDIKAVSHETIYQYVWADKRKGGSLYKQFRYHGKKYNKRSKGTSGRGCIPGRIDIDKRPPIAGKKLRLGDWELDTIIGAGQSGAIVSMVEKSSKFTILVLIAAKTAQEVEAALVTRLSPIKEWVLTLTSDNGKEFANHQIVSDMLNAEFYFAKPYHSWERGLNEHTNGLVRQYFPKSTRFCEVSAEDVAQVEALLNNRPRKALSFLTPVEAFAWLMKQSPIIMLHT